MKVSPCPCCNGAGSHSAGPCLYCSGDGRVTDRSWVHYCPNAETTATHAGKVRRTSGRQLAADPHIASDDFIAAANPILTEVRASDDRIRELRDRYDSAFIPLVREIAQGLSSDEVVRMHVVVELLREQRAQIERQRQLWFLAVDLLASSGMVDATKPGD